MDAKIRGTIDRAGRGLIGAAVLCALLVSTAIAIPTTQRTFPLRMWIDQLADRDPAVRAEAEAKLLQITSDDLPALAEVARSARPLRPSQIAALHDVVEHVWIYSSTYPAAAGNPGFLGVSWDTSTERDDKTTAGVQIGWRIPGFSAYAQLRDRDLVTGIAERPGVIFIKRNDVIATIREFQAGDTITLQVVRRGKEIQVPVQLRPKPAALVARGNDALDEWLDDQLVAVDAYWDAHFSGLGDDAS